MSPANGHANGAGVSQSSQTTGPLAAADVLDGPATPPFVSQEVQGLFKELEVPFDPSVIEWRVTNATKDKTRGQVIPYADQRAYTDRLNLLVTPAGWTRKYAIHTSANFQRGKDQRIVAKILVTCELTIFGLGSHSATGEEWADDDNAGTSAEAQAFKRACSCFGLGRYLYYFTGVWVDLDDRKRPKTVPKLPNWATPEDWRTGSRPCREAHSKSTKATPNPSDRNGNPRQERNAVGCEPSAVVQQIEAMAQPLGKRLYRGLLKTVAQAWSPGQIQDVALQHKVLEHMQAAERGLGRLQAVLERVGAGALSPVMRSLQLTSLDQVDNLETMKRIILALEAKGPERSSS
jgi:hypothetical protein